MRLLSVVLCIVALALVNVKTAQADGYNWSGLYAGIQAGGAWGNVDFTDVLAPINLPVSSSHSSDGGVGGVHLGMHRQFGRWVLGGELNISGADIAAKPGTDCLSTAVPGGALKLSQFACEIEVKWLAAGTFKIGYAMDRWLIYGDVGWTFAGIDLKSRTTMGNVGSFRSHTGNGLTIGAGVEYAFVDGMSFGLEYSRISLETAGVLNGFASTSDIDLDIVKARLNITWGG